MPALPKEHHFKYFFKDKNQIIISAAGEAFADNTKWFYIKIAAANQQKVEDSIGQYIACSLPSHEERWIHVKGFENIRRAVRKLNNDKILSTGDHNKIARNFPAPNNRISPLSIAMQSLLADDSDEEPEENSGRLTPL